MTSSVGIVLRRLWRSLRSDAFLLIVFNFAWLVASAPGWLLVTYGAAGRYLSLIAVGIVLLVPWPLATFGLFMVVYQIGRGRVVAVRDFFRWTVDRWRLALAWGVLNLLVLAVLFSNVRFYISGSSPLGGSAAGAIVSSLFLSAVAAWTVWQMLTLPVIARSSAQGLRHAFRSAGSILARRPLDIFIIVLLALILAFASVVIVPLGLLAGAVLIAALADATVAVTLGEPDPEAPISGAT